MEKLLKEERLILRALSLYGCLTYKQLRKLIIYKGDSTVDAILTSLKKRQLIEEFGGGYVRLDPRTEPDDKLINAFWVFLERISKFKDVPNYKADYPSEIYFLKDNSMYEIVTLREGEEYLLKALFLENRNNSQEDEDKMKYIIIVPSTDAIESCVKNIPQDVIDGKQVLFATVNYSVGEDEPDIQYYRC